MGYKVMSYRKTTINLNFGKAIGLNLPMSYVCELGPEGNGAKFKPTISCLRQHKDA